MNNMQAMIQNVQKLQRQYEKEHQAIEEKEYSYTSGAIKMVMKGNLDLVSITFVDEEILEKDNAEMISEMIKLAFDHIKEEINADEEALTNKFNKGLPGGFKF